MAKIEANTLKFLLLVGVLYFVLVSHVDCDAKQQKTRRGITEWRFKRMNDLASGVQKFGEYEFYLR